MESERPDALFRDPLAGRLAGEKGRAIAESFKAAKGVTGWSVVVRTVVIDDFIRAAIAEGVDTVVNLGAGLDTRPYRLDLPPALRWVEADYPDVIEFKKDRLLGETPTCSLERIGIDLAEEGARRGLLARLDVESRRILFLTEGVVPYLDEGEAGALAADLRGVAHMDSWIVDYISPEAHAYRERAGVDRAMTKSPFKFRPADWERFFHERGWRVREMRFLPREGVRLGRRMPLPWSARVFMRLTGWLASREKRAAMGRSLGYARLEPAPL